VPRATQRRRDISKLGSRGAEDDVQERDDTELERGRQRRLDVGVYLRLVELTQYLVRETFDAEPQHPESSATHGREPFR
jgi:hypothetical protein